MNPFERRMILELCFTIATLDREASQQRNIKAGRLIYRQPNVDLTHGNLPIMADCYLGGCHATFGYSDVISAALPP
jgi:hypothetical protein